MAISLEETLPEDAVLHVKDLVTMGEILPFLTQIICNLTIVLIHWLQLSFDESNDAYKIKFAVHSIYDSELHGSQSSMKHNKLRLVTMIKYILISNFVLLAWILLAVKKEETPYQLHVQQGKWCI